MVQKFEKSPIVSISASVFISSLIWSSLIWSFATPSFAAEDWKGQPTSHDYQVGGLAGLGVIDSSGGAAVLGTVARRIAPNGFIPDINNVAWIEAEVGPLFTSGTSAFFYSAHLRLDFTKDDTWTFYAIGGLGGNIQSSKLGGHFELYPRFGIGTLWDVGAPFKIRGEVSHELIGVGVTFSL